MSSQFLCHYLLLPFDYDLLYQHFIGSVLLYFPKILKARQLADQIGRPDPHCDLSRDPVQNKFPIN